MIDKRHLTRLGEKAVVDQASDVNVQATFLQLDGAIPTVRSK